MRPVQYFTDEYLEQCKRMKPADILRFLDEFRRLHAPGRRSGSRLISLKVPEELLEAFKAKARLHDVRYQTQIKHLMTEWVAGHPTDSRAEKHGASRRRREAAGKMQGRVSSPQGGSRCPYGKS